MKIKTLLILFVGYLAATYKIPQTVLVNIPPKYRIAAIILTVVFIIGNIANRTIINWHIQNKLN